MYYTQSNKTNVSNRIFRKSTHLIRNKKEIYSELKTLECDILNPDLLTFLEINSYGEQAIFNLDIKKKFGLSINPDIHHSKVSSSVQLPYIAGHSL